jgi:hypothetical protein
MNAPIERNEKTGAPTLSPNFRGQQMADSVHEQKQDNPGELPAPDLRIDPNHQQHGAADFSRIGRNFRNGSRTNFNFAKNFAIKTPTTAIGPNAFSPGSGCLNFGGSSCLFRFECSMEN